MEKEHKRKEGLDDNKEHPNSKKTSNGKRQKVLGKTPKYTKVDKKKPIPTDMLANLVITRGHIGNACKLTGISRETHYLWMKDPKYAEGIARSREFIVDMAEERLQEFISTPSEDTIRATTFALKTLGRKRGYIEKQEFEHTGEMIQNVNHIGFKELIAKIRETKMLEVEDDKKHGQKAAEQGTS
jgi:hypothetical protein